MNANDRSVTENTTLLLGRALMSAIFIWGGYGKALAGAATIASFGKLGLPAPAVAYLLAVVIELGGGVLLLAGGFTRIVGVILGVWCIATALVAHANFADRNMEIHFFKNVAMMGGFAYVAVFGAGAFSLDALMRRRKEISVGEGLRRG